ncbi:MAG: hypothetical protein RMM30_02200 [Armatimonadota bacterium]|nr:hypothetical protein [Armatimonadota bacterium]MDW8155384.1 hypothetical protein [Armatimonadota bacterium]
MRVLWKSQRGFSTWAVVAVLAVLVTGCFVLLGIGGVAWYLLAQRPTPPPPAPQPTAPPLQPSGPPPGPLPALQPTPAAPPTPDPRTGPSPASLSLYIDPQGEFCVRYPAGWQVLPHRAGVAFAPPGEDPQNGTSAFFTRLLGVQGRIVPAREDLESFTAQMRQRHPDFRVDALSVRPMPQDSESAFLQASWTNARGEPMRGVLIGLYLHSAVARFTLKQWKTFQSQQVAWSSLEPVFQQMARSFTPLRQGQQEGKPEPACQ